jgi:hypothetical protein
MLDVASLPDVLQVLIAQLAAFLALLLLASALHKLLGRTRALAAIHEFGGVPRQLAPAALALVASGELAAGLLLWLPSHRAAGGALAALLFGVYLALIVRAITQGRREIDCGCTFGGAPRPSSAYHVARNTVLCVGGLLIAVGTAPSDGDGFVVSQMLAAFALLALYFALDETLALSAPRAGELL